MSSQNCEITRRDWSDEESEDTQYPKFERRLLTQDANRFIESCTQKSTCPFPQMQTSSSVSEEFNGIEENDLEVSREFEVLSLENDECDLKVSQIQPLINDKDEVDGTLLSPPDAFLATQVRKEKMKLQTKDVVNHNQHESTSSAYGSLKFFHNPANTKNQTKNAENMVQATNKMPVCSRVPVDQFIMQSVSLLAQNTPNIKPAEKTAEEYSRTKTDKSVMIQKPRLVDDMCSYKCNNFDVLKDTTNVPLQRIPAHKQIQEYGFETVLNTRGTCEFEKFKSVCVQTMVSSINFNWKNGVYISSQRSIDALCLEAPKTKDSIVKPFCVCKASKDILSPTNMHKKKGSLRKGGQAERPRVRVGLSRRGKVKPLHKTVAYQIMMSSRNAYE